MSNDALSSPSNTGSGGGKLLYYIIVDILTYFYVGPGGNPYKSGNGRGCHSGVRGGGGGGGRGGASGMQQQFYQRTPYR